MPPARLFAAASNNAAWCEAVCRAHGHPGEVAGPVWLNRAEVPPFYPNVVTLTPEDPAQQLEAISSLDVPGRWAVKDSFATLDLRSQGFAELFSAQWIQLTQPMPLPAAASGARWTRVRDRAGLAAWEDAWGRQLGDLRPTRAVFLPPLLEDPNTAILAAFLGDTLVAGAIAYRDSGVVGLSNTFFAADTASALRAELITQIASVFPDLPLVGYEHGDELDTWCGLGFEPLGPLRVWLKTAEAQCTSPRWA